MSFGITELLIILVIVVLLFGTTKLKSMGSDLGGAIKGFRNAVGDNQAEEPENSAEAKVEKKESETTES